MSIRENVLKIKEDIAALAPERKVYLVAATKMNDASRVREAIAAGIDACGENRVQELVAKDAEGAYDGCPLHFIGNIQSNKLNKIVGRTDLIQSVGSEDILLAIDRRARTLGTVQDILIQVNAAGEEQKGGIEPSALPAFLERASACGGIRVRGLMCIPPVEEKNGENRPYFAAMRQLFIDNGDKKYDNVSMDFLSMGMSDDYAEAISEGANMVRVGSAIFGARQYTTTGG